MEIHSRDVAEPSGCAAVDVGFDGEQVESIQEDVGFDVVLLGEPHVDVAHGADAAGVERFEELESAG